MGFFIGFLNVLLLVSSIFLICLVLIQRGKGGGLAGAFGGPGGSSAFGAKAGDVFTRITIITAGVWIALAMMLVLAINNAGPQSSFRGARTPATREVEPNEFGTAASPDVGGTVDEGPPPGVPAPVTPEDKKSFAPVAPEEKKP